MSKLDDYDEDNPDPRVVYGSFSLGEGMDCETCGPSWDEAEVASFPDGKIEVRLSYGCYGGDRYEGDPATVLAAMREDWPESRIHGGSLRGVRDVIAWVKKQKGGAA